MLVHILVISFSQFSYLFFSIYISLFALNIKNIEIMTVAIQLKILQNLSFNNWFLNSY
jgi:hypothetical protein